MIDFIYENLLPKAVKGVHLKVKVMVKMKVEVKGVVHLNINRDVLIRFSGQSLGRTSKVLVLVFNQPDLRES